MSGVRRADVEGQLAAVMGDEHARDLVRRTLSALGVPPGQWDDGVAERLIAHLASSSGVAGAAARLLRSRTISSSSMRAVPLAGGWHGASRPDPTPARGDPTPLRVEPVPTRRDVTPTRPDPVARATAPTPASGLHVAAGNEAFVKLVTMLGASLGDAKARTLVDEVVQRRGIDRLAFGKDDAIAVLEELAATPGVVGTVARFAKARVHLELG